MQLKAPTPNPAGSHNAVIDRVFYWLLKRDNYCMHEFDDDHIYQYAKSVMFQIMTVLYINGRTEAHVGAIMRLLGVDEDHARLHDDERIELDENFARIAAELNMTELVSAQVPQGTTIH
jgi:hypothetical protein